MRLGRFEKRWWLIALGATFALAAVLSWLLALPIWAGWLIAINGALFALYGYDKSAAGDGRSRVPERVLHGLALLGGSPAALSAQRIFRHKTAKRSFQVACWIIVGAQGVLAAWYVLRAASAL